MCSMCVCEKYVSYRINIYIYITYPAYQCIEIYVRILGIDSLSRSILPICRFRPLMSLNRSDVMVYIYGFIWIYDVWRRPLYWCSGYDPQILQLWLVSAAVFGTAYRLPFKLSSNNWYATLDQGWSLPPSLGYLYKSSTAPLSNCVLQAAWYK